MTSFRYGVAALAAGAFFCSAVFVMAAAQNLGSGGAPAAPATQRPQFFAGTVVELDASHIKVTRTPVGRPTESRSFTITPATKMNKAAIKVHNRVTVRYRRLPEGGEVALEIHPVPVMARTPKG